MVHRIIELLDRKFGFEQASAHCDVPCGIYDPIKAQISALTVVRMIDLLNEKVAGFSNDNGSAPDAEFINSVARYVAVKEEHAEECKHEIRIIVGDYFKEPHYEQYPELAGLVLKILQLGSKSRQTADREAAVALVEAVNQFAEVFWATKGVKTKRATAPYAPALELVYPDL